jgi:hypothetical protein
MSVFLFLIPAPFTADLKACFGEHLLKKNGALCITSHIWNKKTIVLKANVFHTGVCVESVLAKRKQRNGLVERRFTHLGFVHLSQVQDPC